jgi:hypothetical protein
MLADRIPGLSPGLYRVPTGSDYLVRDGAVRRVRANGQPSRYIVARLAGTGLKVTGNGQGHETALHAPATGQATQIEHHCSRCSAPLSDPVSIARAVGPECAKAVA